MYEMARQGLLPVMRLGRQVKMNERKLQEWINRGGQALTGGRRKEPAD
jgi:transposase-like protein